jgi:hypothetical protein
MAANSDKSRADAVQSLHLMVKSAEGARAKVDRAVASRRASKVLARVVRTA